MSTFFCDHFGPIQQINLFFFLQFLHFFLQFPYLCAPPIFSFPIRFWPKNQSPHSGADWPCHFIPAIPNSSFSKTQFNGMRIGPYCRQIVKQVTEIINMEFLLFDTMEFIMEERKCGERGGNGEWMIIGFGLVYYCDSCPYCSYVQKWWIKQKQVWMKKNSWKNSTGVFLRFWWSPALAKQNFFSNNSPILIYQRSKTEQKK